MLQAVVAFLTLGAVVAGVSAANEAGKAAGERIPAEGRNAAIALGVIAGITFLVMRARKK